jgi:hypothetical protein
VGARRLTALLAASMIALVACSEERTPLPVVTAAPTPTPASTAQVAPEVRPPVFHLDVVAESELGTRIWETFAGAQMIVSDAPDTADGADAAIGRQVNSGADSPAVPVLVLPAALVLNAGQPPFDDLAFLEMAADTLSGLAAGTLPAQYSRTALANAGFPDGITLTAGRAPVDQTGNLREAGWNLTTSSSQENVPVQVLWGTAAEDASENPQTRLIRGFSMTLLAWVNPASAVLDGAALGAIFSPR